MRRILFALAMTFGLTLSVMTPAHAWDRWDLTHVQDDAYKHFACKKVRGFEVKVHTFSYGYVNKNSNHGVYSALYGGKQKIVEKNSTKRDGWRIRTILVAPADPGLSVWVQADYYNPVKNPQTVPVSSLRECPWQ